MESMPRRLSIGMKKRAYSGTGGRIRPKYAHFFVWSGNPGEEGRMVQMEKYGIKRHEMGYHAVAFFS